MAYIRVFAPISQVNKNEYWCRNCQCWVKLRDTKTYCQGQGWEVDRLCPVCNLVLVQVVYDPDEL